MDEPVPPVYKAVSIIISPHSRERWVQRILDPQHYSHMDECNIVNGGCGICNTLIRDLRAVISLVYRDITRNIVRAYQEAKGRGAKVVDPVFLEIVKKRHGHNCVFYQTGNIVLVVSLDQADGTPPVLISVWTARMIEGTILRHGDAEDMKSVFNRWKHNVRKGRP